jgi:DNA topoisomerase IB
MSRLRRVDCAGPGIARIGRGRGFAYVDADGRPMREPEVLERINELAIPPAWRDVWICPYPNGHIQAIGTDAAGRRQYRYHDVWRKKRDEAKHDRVLEFARRLPAAREQAAEHLAVPDMSRERALAAAFMLLDLGFFRIGGEAYAEANGTYGLATMLREHVTVSGRLIVFAYLAKGSQERVQSIAHDDVRAVVQTLKRRRGGGEELLAYKRDGRWYDIRSADINDYVSELVGPDIETSAKDFRTWHATVLMAVGLAVSTSAPTSTTARRRAVNRALGEVAHYLGNTPAVCRASYVDPRVIDLYDDGVTIRRSLDKLGADVDPGEPATRGAIEAAVLRMLRQSPRAAQRRAS